MQDNYFIGIYWGNREEEKLDCVSKVKATFDFLCSLDESFNTWYKTTKPRKGETLVPVDTSSEGVKALLQQGQNYNDVGELLKDVGYLIYLKSEKDYSKAHILSITCGCYFEKISNHVTLNVGKNQAYKHLMNEELLEKLYAGLVKIWKPEKGVVRCNNDELIANTFS